jgi:hypothetical protein
MEQRQLFETGARLLGLYFLVRVLPYFVGSITQAVILFGTTGQVFVRERLYDSLSLVSDVLLVVIGLCLLKGSHFIRRIALQEQEDASTSRIKEFFTVGVKLVGVLLAVGTIPSLMRALSYFLFIATSPSDSANTAVHVMGSKAYFVPQFVSILFGVLLFFRGELLSSWAFAERKAVENSD